MGSKSTKKAKSGKSDLSGASSNPSPKSGTDAECETCKDHFVEFVVKDQFATLVSGVDYKVTGPSKFLQSGSLSNGKVRYEKVKEGSYTLALKQIASVKWEDGKDVVIDAKIKLEATVTGFDAGTAGTFKILDAHDVNGAELDSVAATVKKGILSGSWKPEAAKLSGLASGLVVFVAEIGNEKMISEAQYVYQKHIVEVTLDSAKANARVVLGFTGGSVVDTTSSKGKAEALIVLGEKLSWAELPDHKGARITVDNEGTTREYLQV